ncbi:hypothetical protein N431DRAFT_470113 [Stipitochalara longipes BDJ]|nr:hypothetical protein N431DRAFT_470113 [Stipitochalara longipes BDJ]
MTGAGSDGSPGGESVPPPISPDDVFIAVMGLTGAGKSTFISECTGEDAGVGHMLESSTAEVSISSFEHNERTVHLIDTPGINDSGRTELDVLKEIAFWLTAAHDNSIQLNGIVYLHSIAAPKWAASCAKATTLLKAICGPENYPSIVLATTHWDSVSADIGNKRHEELSENEDMWGSLRTGGAILSYHSSGKTSAVRIINHLMRQPKCTLAIQIELDSPEKKLSDTEAGREIIELWGYQLSALEEEIKKQTELDLRDANQLRKESMAELQEQFKKQQTYIVDSQITREQLHSEWEARNEGRLRKLRWEREEIEGKIEEVQLLQGDCAVYEQERNMELERLKRRAKELDRLEMNNIAGRSLEVSKKSMYLSGLGVAVGVASLAAACACTVM